MYSPQFIAATPTETGVTMTAAMRAVMLLEGTSCQLLTVAKVLMELVVWFQVHTTKDRSQ
jgi:hypothetical protein